MAKKITIGVCCYNEEENIELMYQAITSEMKPLKNYDYEIIFEDNNSTDSSQQILKEICQKDKHVKWILNQTNFGVDRSTANCMLNASGDAYIGIACDFQDPPTMIPHFIEEWAKGCDIVWGQKVSSKEGMVKKCCRKLYYRVIDAFSDYTQIRDCVGFGLMDRKVLDILLLTIRQDPYVHVRHLACEYGFKIMLLPYEQQKRERGKSSYNISSYYSFAITSLCNTSTKPLRIMSIIGIFTAVGSFSVALVYFLYKITHWDTFNAGMAPVIIGLFFLAAVQLICIGILGEYVGVLLRKVTNKPIVVEKEKINFDDKESDSVC